MNKSMPQKGMPPKGMPKPEKVDKKTVLRLFSLLLPYRTRLFFVILCILLSALTGVASSLFIKTLIDGYISPLLLAAVPDFAGLLRALLVMACIYLVGALSTLFYNRIMITVSQGVLKRVRDGLFEKMQHLPVKYFDTHAHGDIMSIYTNDTDTLYQMISQSIPQIFSSLISVVAVFFSMLFLSVYLTLFVLLFVFIMVFLSGKVAGKSAGFFIRQQESLGTLNGYIEEMIHGQKVVKVFCREEAAKKEFHEKADAWRKNSTAANTFSNMLMPMMSAIGYFLYVSIAIAGGCLAVAGISNLSLTGMNVMTLGMIASFLTLSKNFTNPIAQISSQLNSIIMALAGAKRIFALLDEPPETDDGYVTLVNAKEENGVLTETAEHTGLWAWKHPHQADGSVTYVPLCGDVVMEHVDFGYTEEKTVLHDISLYAKPGQKVAFVGATGAGKTTITNLINRFYDVSDGKVRYDGININKIKKADLRRSLGVVLQDVNLFTDTVMENIRYGNLAATDEDCIRASKLANADSFIRMLPDGYQTVLSGDGSGLSQGQRQLLSIARAAVADPPVMILDEATSSIDTHTEALVQRGMDRLMEGRTVFVIAHRLSTVQNSDVIMVLDQGRIIERGDHASLIAEKGTYYRLYTGAFELE